QLSEAVALGVDELALVLVVGVERVEGGGGVVDLALAGLQLVAVLLLDGLAGALLVLAVVGEVVLDLLVEVEAHAPRDGEEQLARVVGEEAELEPGVPADRQAGAD